MSWFTSDNLVRINSLKKKIKTRKIQKIKILSFSFFLPDISHRGLRGMLLWCPWEWVCLDFCQYRVQAALPYNILNYWWQREWMPANIHFYMWRGEKEMREIGLHKYRAAFLNPFVWFWGLWSKARFKCHEHPKRLKVPPWLTANTEELMES